MTSIKSDSPVKRETATIYRGQPLIVELHPGYMVVRRKGYPKSKVAVSYDAIYDLGQKLVAREELKRQ